MPLRRLPGYDYSLPGYYFLTICTLDKRCLFGNVINDQMHLNSVGHIAQGIWRTLPRKFPHVQLHEYIFMPNHIHVLLELIKTEQPQEAPRASLFGIIRHFKAVSTFQIRRSEGKPWFAWQDRFWDTVVRDDETLAKIRHYINTNPERWKQDKLYVPAHYAPRLQKTH